MHKSINCSRRIYVANIGKYTFLPGQVYDWSVYPEAESYIPITIHIVLC